MRKFFGTVKNGIVRHYKPNEYQEYLNTIQGEFEEIIGPKEVQATRNQKAYFFATNRWLIDNIEEFGGWNETEIKNFAYSLFSCTIVERTDHNGEVHKFKVYESISDMSKKRMSEFISHWILWLDEQGIKAPSPEDAITAKYRKVVDV